MTKKPIPSKSGEERRKEAEKLKVETERSLEVIKMKRAHGIIEEIERLRKKAPIRSLLARIKAHSTTIIGTADTVSVWVKKGIPLNPPEIELIRELMRIYESIRIDFKEVMELSDEKLEQQFPKINTDFKTRTQALTILNNILGQELQMVMYSIRMM